MSISMKNIVALLLVITLVGCSKIVDIQLTPEVELLSSDNAEHRIRLTQKDEAYVFLNSWLNENKADWYTTSGRYPGGVYVESGDYGIQITELKVVLYSRTRNETKAIYIQEIEKGELSLVVNLAK